MKSTPLQRIFLIFIFYFFIIGIFQILGMYLANIDLSKSISKIKVNQLLLVQFFILIGTLILVFVFTKHLDKKNILVIGFKTDKNGIDLYLNLAFLLFFILTFLFFHFSGQIKIIGITLVPSILAKTVLLYLIVSLTEEIFLRGYILRNLLLTFNRTISLIITSLIFILLHIENDGLNTLGIISLFLFSYILGYLYIKTESIFSPIIFHFSWNILQTLFGFNVSGLDTYSIFEIERTENNVINGGEFGFEASIISISLQVIIFLSLCIYFNLKSTYNNSTVDKII